MDELKNLIMSAYAYQRVVNNWKNPSNNKKKTIDYINNALAEMEKELKEIDENFSIKSQYDKNQSKVNDEQNTIKNKGNRGFKEDAFKEIEAKFKALVEKIKQDKKGEIKPDIGKNEEDEFKHIEPDNKKGDVKNMDEIGEDAHDIDNEEEIGLESKEELLEQLESFKAEEKEIQEQIKIAKVEVEKTEDDYAKEYYAEEVDYEKLVAADKRDKDASAKVEKLENDLNIIRKNMKLVNLKISKLDLEKEKENYLNQEPRDKSSYIWKEWNEDIKKIEAEIESINKKIKELENELNEKDTTKEQDEIPEDEQDAYNAVSGKKVYTKEQLESMLERLEKQKQRLENTLAYMLNTEPSDKESKEHTKWKNDIEMLKGRISKVNKNIQEIKNMLKEYEQDSDIDKRGNTDSPNKKQKPPVKPLNGKNDPNRLPDGEIPRRLPEEVEKQKKSPVKKDPSLPEGEIPRRLPAEVEKQNKALPIRSFYEIYNSTNTQHISTFARAMYNLSHARLWDRNTDTVQKVLNAALFVPKLVSKAFSKPVNFLLRTDRKMQDMTRAVENLSPQEFDVLTNESSNYRREYEKSTYLSPLAMKEMKANNGYLDVVYSRLHRENSGRIGQLNEAGNLCHQHCDNIILEFLTEDEKNSYRELSTLDYAGRLRPEQRSALETMRANALRQFDDDARNRWGFFYNMAKANREHAERIANEDAKFKAGTELKSAGYKNIAGWFLGKFNPDNREMNEEVARLAEARREEYDQRGHTYGVDVYSKQIENVLNGATRITQVGRNEHNSIDRGDSSRGNDVKMLDKGKQTKTRQVLAIAGMGLAIAKFFHMRNLQSKMEELQTQNKQVDYQYSQTKVEHVAGVDADKIKAAEEQLKAKDNLGIEDISERTSLNDNGWNIGSSGYRNADVITHQRASATMSANNLSNSESTFDSVAQEAIKSNTQYQANYDMADQFGSAGYIENLRNAQGHSITDVFEAAKRGQDIAVTVSGTGTINIPYSTFEQITMNDIIGFPDYVAMGIAGGATMYGANLGNVIRNPRNGRPNRGNNRGNNRVTTRNQEPGQDQNINDGEEVEI